MNKTDNFSRHGFTIIEGLITEDQLAQIEQQLIQFKLTNAGSRELLTQPWCQQLAETLKMNAQLAPLLPINTVAIQCTYFKKTAEKKLVGGFTSGFKHSCQTPLIRKRV